MRSRRRRRDSQQLIASGRLVAVASEPISKSDVGVAGSVTSRWGRPWLHSALENRDERAHHLIHIWSMSGESPGAALNW